MNRIKLKTDDLPNKLFFANKGKLTLDEIVFAIYKFKQNTLAFYSHINKVIYINGNELKKCYSNEDELIEILIPILSHEYFHYILHKQEGHDICKAFDNDWLLEILEDYGIISKRQVLKLYILHHTFIY